MVLMRKLKFVMWLLIGSLLIGGVVCGLFSEKKFCGDVGRDLVPVGPLSDGRVVEQPFTAAEDGLTSVELVFATYIRKNEGGLVVSVIDVAERSELVRRVVDMGELTDNAAVEFVFNPQGESAGRQYLVRLRGLGGSPVCSATVYLARDVGREACLVDGRRDGGLCLAMRQGYRLSSVTVWNAGMAVGAFLLCWALLFLVFRNRIEPSTYMPLSIAAFLVVTILIWGACDQCPKVSEVKSLSLMLKLAFGGGLLLLSVLVSAASAAVCLKVPREWIFLLVFLPISTAMSFCMPPSCVPDEGTHFFGTYVVASGQFVRSSNEVELPRDCMKDCNPSGASVTKALRRLLRGCDWSEDSELARYGENGAVYPAMAYLPQAVAMRVGTLFYRNYMFALYAARMGSILLTAFLLFLAIRIAPTGKDVFLYVALLPMALQETASVSADGMAIASVALCSAFYLKFAVPGNVVRSRHIVLAGLLAAALVSFKVMYLPFAGLFFLLPRSAFGGDGATRRRFFTVVVASVLLTVSIWWVLSILPLLHSPSAPTTNRVADNFLFWANRLPLAFSVFCRTVFQHAWEWFGQMIGVSLSYYNVPVADIVFLMFVLSGCFVFWSGRSPGRFVGRGGRGLMCCSVICALVVIVMLWFWWTSTDAPRIEGVQGRYFLPMLAPFLIALRGGEGTDGGSVRCRLYLYAVLMVADVCALVCVLTSKWV